MEPTVLFHSFDEGVRFLRRETARLTEPPFEGVQHLIRHLLGVASDEEAAPFLVKEVFQKKLLSENLVLHVNLVLLREIRTREIL